MKRRDLIRHLVDHDCALVREGSNHSWWGHTTTQRRTAVPRHREIDIELVKKICKDLGIPAPK
jgi:mRNA interferase HicA